MLNRAVVDERVKQGTMPDLERLVTSIKSQHEANHLLVEAVWGFFAQIKFGRNTSYYLNNLAIFCSQLRIALKLPKFSLSWKTDADTNRALISEHLKTTYGVSEENLNIYLDDLCSLFSERELDCDLQQEQKEGVPQAAPSVAMTPTSPRQATDAKLEDKEADLAAMQVIDFIRGFAQEDEILVCRDELSAVRELRKKSQGIKNEADKLVAQMSKPYVCVVNEKDFSVKLYVPKAQAPGYRVARCDFVFSHRFKHQEKFYFNHVGLWHGNLAAIGRALMQGEKSFEVECPCDTQIAVQNKLARHQAQAAKEQKSEQPKQISLAVVIHPKYHQMLYVIRLLQDYLQDQIARLKPRIKDFFNKGIRDKNRLFELVSERLAAIQAQITNPDADTAELNTKVDQLEQELAVCITDCGTIAHHHRREDVDKFANFFISAIPKVKPIVPPSWKDWRRGNVGIPKDCKLLYQAYQATLDEKIHTKERYNEYRRAAYDTKPEKYKVKLG